MNMSGHPDAGLEYGQIVSTYLSNEVPRWIANSADRYRAKTSLLQCTKSI